MDDYIDKPVRLAALARALTACPPRRDRAMEAAAASVAGASAAPPHLATPAEPPAEPSTPAAGQPFRDASLGLLNQLRAAADTANGTAGAEIARKLRAVCMDYNITSLLRPLQELAAMSAEDFTRQGIIKVAQIQREHRAVLISPLPPPRTPLPSEK